MGCKCKKAKNINEASYSVMEDIFANRLTFFQRLKIVSLFLWHKLKYKLKGSNE